MSTTTVERQAGEIEPGAQPTRCLADTLLGVDVANQVPAGDLAVARRSGEHRLSNGGSPLRWRSSTARGSVANQLSSEHASSRSSRWKYAFTSGRLS